MNNRQQQASHSSLSVREIEFYSRQLLIKGWSSELQSRFKLLHVAVPDTLITASLYLACLGIGKLSLRLSPLSRKPDKLLKHLGSLNPELNLIVTQETGVSSTAFSTRADCEIRIKNELEQVSEHVSTYSESHGALLLIDPTSSPLELKLFDTAKNPNSLAETTIEWPSTATSAYLLAGTAAVCMIVKWCKNKDFCR